MVEADTLNLIGIIAIFIVIIMVSILIIRSQGVALTAGLPAQFQNVFNSFAGTLIQKSPYNICEAYTGREVSVQDFQTVLQAVYHGQCGDIHANISLTFSLTQADISKIVKLSGLAGGGNLIFYNVTNPLGVGAIIISGNQGSYPLKTFDFIDMYQQGSPTPDTFIIRTIKGCDPTDNVCDPICLYKGICDPVCDNGQQYNIPCNLACIDINNNGIIDITDANARIKAGKCNPDCYSSKLNPNKAYDPGCKWKKITDPKYAKLFNGTCDPNSNGVIDGICDPDCIKTKNICDPNCNGTVYPGNPQGLYDAKCFVCDKTCNGWCSPACTAFDNDPDCPAGYNGTRADCCGNGICNVTSGKNCENCPQDCPGGGTSCGSYNNICCPKDPNSDQIGCTINKDKKEGASCFCKNQCGPGLSCDKKNHCCPTGKSWNGTACIVPNTYNLVFVPVGYSSYDAFKSDAQKAYNYFLTQIPLRECSDEKDRIQAIYVDPSSSSACSISSCSNICTDCNDLAVNCVNSLPDVRSIVNRISAICNGGSCGSVACGCANGIPGTSSASNMQSCRGILYEIPTHEIGHTMGLCHDPCGGASGACLSWCANAADCSQPGVDNFIMGYCPPWTGYGSIAYSYLKNNEFKKYMC